MKAKNKSDQHILDRLLEKSTKQNSGCITYGKHKTIYGYGQFWMHGKLYQAHRAAYELVKGKLRPGQVLLHTCDNRKCINPAHLKAGSKADNNNDMAKKGRIRNQYTGPMKSSPRGKGLQKD